MLYSSFNFYSFLVQAILYQELQEALIEITAQKDYLQVLALHFYEIIIKAKLQLAILMKDYFTLKPQEYIALIA